jgi:uncharacterized protein (DUF1330 family)
VVTAACRNRRVVYSASRCDDDRRRTSKEKTMPAYFIAEVDVQDAALYESYRPIAAATIAEHGGRFVVRGGKTETMEGGWAPKRFVIVEFPTMAQAKAWYESPDYRKGLEIRLKASKSRAILVEGLPPG